MIIENNLNISSTVNVEFEELYARFISEDKSANLCNDSIHVCMKPKMIEKSPPVCLICVVDISYSMNHNCANTIENLESIYVSRLNLVKHSLKTIVLSLRKEDVISIITFDKITEMRVTPTVTKNKKVKDKIIDSIEKIKERGTTNMWDGIKMAIDTSSYIPYDKYQKSIMVFTDGESNVNPPEGIYQALKNKLDACRDHDKFTLSTFSFGNSIKPKLLVDIAKLGNGIYGYCPDGSMVGTIFINYMANLLSTLTPLIKVNLIQGNKIKKSRIIGPLYRGTYRNAFFSEIDKNLLNDTKITIELPMLNQIIEVPLNKESVDLSRFMDESSEELEEEKKQNEINNGSDDDPNKDNDNDSNSDSDSDDELLDEESDDEEILENINTDIIIDEKDTTLPIKYEEILLNQILRNKFVYTLNKIIEIENLGRNQEENQVAQAILNEYYDLLHPLNYKNKFINGLLMDIKDPDPNHGQVEKAMDLKYYESWGKPYLYSFLRFHEFEQCGNFKDQSLQYYAFKVFNTYKEIANTIFNNLPPPGEIFNLRDMYNTTKGNNSYSSTNNIVYRRRSMNNENVINRGRFTFINRENSSDNINRRRDIDGNHFIYINRVSSSSSSSSRDNITRRSNMAESSLSNIDSLNRRDNSFIGSTIHRDRFSINSESGNDDTTRRSSMTESSRSSINSLSSKNNINNKTILKASVKNSYNLGILSNMIDNNKISKCYNSIDMNCCNSLSSLNGNNRNYSYKSSGNDNNSQSVKNSINSINSIRNNPPSIRMRYFNNPNGGCFNGDALVLLEDGRSKRVRDLKKGDRLSNHAIVQCLIEQSISNTNKLLSQSMMCNIHGVLLTPYHPVKVENQWYFPRDLVQPKPVAIDAWFNLILKDDTHKKYEVEFDNGITAITLGHCRKENKILEHPYFGTDLVLKDLQERDPEGYSNGYIYIKEHNCRQLQYDKNNQYCINYYKIQSNNITTNNFTHKTETLNNNIPKLIY